MPLAPNQASLEIRYTSIANARFITDNHLMTGAPGTPTRPIRELTFTDARGMGHLVVEGGGAETSLICGTVAFDQGDAHPVFSMLPRLIRVRDVDGRMASVVETLIRLIADEVDQADPGTETVVARLTDVLIIYMLRNYINGLEPGEGGWLGGLRDPGIRTALGLIHRSPERNWTAGELASVSGRSRSAFFARFREDGRRDSSRVPDPVACSRREQAAPRRRSDRGGCRPSGGLLHRGRLQQCLRAGHGCTARCIQARGVTRRQRPVFESVPRQDA